MPAAAHRACLKIASAFAEPCDGGSEALVLERASAPAREALGCRQVLLHLVNSAEGVEELYAERATEASAVCSVACGEPPLAQLTAIFAVGAMPPRGDLVPAMRVLAEQIALELTHCRLLHRFAELHFAAGEAP